MNFVDIPDGQLAYEVAGPATATSLPPVVLLHGFPLRHAMWRHQIQWLAQTHRVIAPDLRGHGASLVRTHQITMAQMADDVCTILDTLSIDRPIVLGGLSMGGYVAWEFWRRYPQRLAGLILCDTRAVADTPEVARARQMMAAQVVINGAPFAVDAMLPKLLARSAYDSKPRLVEEVREMILATSPEVIAATQHGLATRADMTSSLGEIRHPALLLCGTDDQISPVAEMEGIAAAMPYATFCEVPDAGHLAPLENPDFVNSQISHFLAQLAPA